MLALINSGIISIFRNLCCSNRTEAQFEIIFLASVLFKLESTVFLKSLYRIIDERFPA